MKKSTFVNAAEGRRKEDPINRLRAQLLWKVRMRIYIYIYIYTRFAYGTLRCLWSRTKYSSKQCTVRSRAISKGISKEKRKCFRSKKKQARAVISSAQRPKSKLEQWFRAPSGYGARSSSDFELSVEKAALVLCFRVFSSAVEGGWTLSNFELSGEFTI